MHFRIISPIFIALFFFIFQPVISFPLSAQKESDIHIIQLEATSRNDSRNRRIISLNGHDNTFGPAIRVHAGDVINLSLRNNICSKEEAELGEINWLWKEYCQTSLHFHGLVPIGNDMDGVPGLTQPPIGHGETFWYNFTVPKEVCGTYWYHSHSSVQYGDGLRGTIVVECDDYSVLINRVVQSLREKPTGLGLLELLPRGDAIRQETIQEEYVTLSDWYQDWNLDIERQKMMIPGGTTDPHMDGSLINGFPNDQLQINLKSDTDTVVLRVVNAGMAGTQVLHAEGTRMVVIETDGTLVKPYALETLSIAVGQRYTVIIDIGNDPIKIINGCNKMMGYITKVLWLLKGQPRGELEFTGNIIDLPGFYRSELYKELEPLPHIGSENTKLLGGAVENDHLQDMQRITLDYQYIRENDEITQKYNTEMYRVNGKTIEEYFESPIEIAKNTSVLEIVINSLDHMRHPWHLHGHHFQVVSLGESRNGALRIDDPEPDGSAIEKYVQDLQYWRQSEKTPMMRDSINIEGNSYAVLRIKPDKPGSWLLHCHVDWHVAKGLGIVIHEQPVKVQATLNSTHMTTQKFPSSKAKVISIYFSVICLLDAILYWIIM